MPHIRVKNGPQKGKILPLSGTQPLIVGRDAACALQIIDKGVSREHAQIFRVGEMVFIRDMGSRNGSFVNEERVQEELLREGDTVRVGVTQLLFESQREQDERRTLQYKEDETFKTSLDLKVEDLYVIEPGSSGREGELFRAMCQATQIVQSEHHEKRLFERLLALIQEYIPADYLYVFVRDESTGAVTPRAMIPKQAGTVVISRSILRRVITESRAILTADAMQDERFKSGESIVMNNIRAVLCVPLQGMGKQALGALYAVNSRLAETFEQIDLQLMTALGTQLALALENLHQIKHRREMFFRTIGRLVSLLEGCPPGKLGHSERVSIYCSVVAAELDLPDGEILNCAMAGLLHDVGKVPALSVLTEADVQRSTGAAPALAASEFLKNVPGLPEALNAIRSHHEHFDGSGVPQQLKGEQIPLGARILGAANIFDKLIYPGGLSVPNMDPEPAVVRKAFLAMDADTGKLFDPEVVKALMVAYRHGELRTITGAVLSAARSESAIHSIQTCETTAANEKVNTPAQGNGIDREELPELGTGETIRTHPQEPRP